MNRSVDPMSSSAPWSSFQAPPPVAPTPAPATAISLIEAALVLIGKLVQLALLLLAGQVTTVLPPTHA